MAAKNGGGDAADAAGHRRERGDNRLGSGEVHIPAERAVRGDIDAHIDDGLPGAVAFYKRLIGDMP